MARSRNNLRNQQRGYTLIELLLVVTVIALIAALGVKTYRDKAQSDRVNIAALDIQHVLEAGMSYRVNQGLWPVANSTTPCAKASTTDSFTTSYLPNANNQSNYGSYICWSGDDDTAGKQKANLFWVAMPIMDSNAASATDVAKRIAAHLPNALITSNPNDSSTNTNACVTLPCYVKAEVAVPSAASTSSDTYMAGAGNCDSAVHNDGFVDNTGKNLFPNGLQPGTTGTVTCKRTTLGQQFTNAANSAVANDDSLSQYQISFQCKPNEQGYVSVTPNFVRVDRYSSSSTYSAGNIYQLSAAPEYNPYRSGTASPSYDIDNCVADNGNITCTVNMAVSIAAQNGDNVGTIGCKDAYTDPGNFNGQSLCVCGYPWNKNDKDYKYKGCPDQPGAVGASYVAICISPSASLASKNPDKSYW